MKKIKIKQEVKKLRKFTHNLSKKKFLAHGPGGNTSIKIGSFLYIKSSGTWFKDSLKENSFTKIDLNSIKKNIKDESKWKFNRLSSYPSIETVIHAIIKKKYVVHLHSVNVLSYAVLKEGKKNLKNKLKDFNWVWIKYKKPGLALGQKIKEINNDPNIYILQNHGIIYAGDTLGEIIKLIQKIEFKLKRIKNLNLKKNIKNYSKINKNFKKPKNKIIQILAWSKLCNVIENKSLYPDHTVFLNNKILYLNNINNNIIQNNFDKKIIVIKKHGVFINKNISNAEYEMLLCLAELLNILPLNSKLSFLNKKEEKELLNWDKEIIRQNINKEQVIGNKMQIIIPMVGNSVRFKEAGYKVPKFLLKINNKLVIEHVLNLFPGEKNFLFICNKKHLLNKKLKLSEILKKICPAGKILGINPHKLGPVHSVLKIMSEIDNNLPIIINYCDFNSYWNYKKFKKIVEEKKYDGCVVVYNGFHPHTIYNNSYGYIKEKNSKVIDIKEKKTFTKNPVNELTSNGTYYFKNKEILNKYIYKSIKEKLHVNNEYYVSMIYKPMIREAKRIGFYKINYFSQWGTPLDFNEYNNWSEKFKNIIKIKRTKNINGILVIPAAGLGKRFINKDYKIHKPLIPVSGKPMIIQSIFTHPNHKFSKVIISKRNNSSEIIEKKVKKYFPKTEIFKLNNLTKGQAITCYKGLKNENQDMPVTIGACDSGLIFDHKKFFKLFDDSNIDVIVWTIKSSYEAIKNPKQYGWVKMKENRINYVSVKKPLNDPNNDLIVLGTFTFKKIKYFTDSVSRMIKRKAKVNNEYYIDTCINDAIKLGYKCQIFNIDSHLPWGNPNDLKTFNYWQKYFDLWKEHPYKNKKFYL